MCGQLEWEGEGAVDREGCREDGGEDEFGIDDDCPLPGLDDDLDLGGEEELPFLDASPDETVLELDTPAEDTLDAPTEDAAVELELDEASGESMVEIDGMAPGEALEEEDEVAPEMETADLDPEGDDVQAAPDVARVEMDVDVAEMESAPPGLSSF